LRRLAAAARQGKTQRIATAADFIAKNGEVRWRKAEEDAQLTIKQTSRNIALADQEVEGDLAKENGEEDAEAKRIRQAMGALDSDAQGLGAATSQELRGAENEVRNAATMEKGALSARMGKLDMIEEQAASDQNSRQTALGSSINSAFGLVGDLERAGAEARNASNHTAYDIMGMLTQNIEAADRQAPGLEGFTAIEMDRIMYTVEGQHRATEKIERQLDKEVPQMYAISKKARADVDSVVGGEAVQKLMAIQKVDHHALGVTENNKKLADWMIDFHGDTREYRAKVDEVLGDEREALGFARLSVRAAAHEQAANAFRLAHLAEQNMAGSLGALTGGSDGLGTDYASQLKSMASIGKAQSDVDDEELNRLGASLNGDAANGEVMSVEDAYNAVRGNLGESKNLQNDMEKRLADLSAYNAKMVDDEKKRIENRLKSFHGDMMGTIAPMTPKQQKEAIQALVKETTELENTHHELDERHFKAGSRINRYYNKVVAALQAEKGATAAKSLLESAAHETPLKTSVDV